MMTTYTALTGPALQMKITAFEKRSFDVVRQMMEAKASRKLTIPHTIGVARIFDWGGAQITNHMQ